MRGWKLLFFVAWAFLAMIAASYIVGCYVSHPPSPGSNGHGPGTTPHDLNGIAWWLEMFAVIAVPITVGAIVAFFLVPEAHRLSTFLGIGGASLFGVSVLLRVSLWLVPWVAGSLGVLAVVALAYELYVKISKNKNVPDLLNLGNSASLA